jgi:3-oxoacyl-(acyl-carrier-protein) synthase
MSTTHDRVVITGLGAVSCLGPEVASFWQGLIENRSGIGPITKFDTTGYRNENGGEVTDFDFDPTAFGLPAEAEVDEATQFALAACAEALADSGLELTDALTKRAGLVLSTNFGGATAWEWFIENQPWDEAEVATALFGEFAFHSAADYAAEALGLGGPTVTLSNSCSSGTSALGYAADLIRHGRAEVMLAGGYDTLSPSSLSGLSVLRTLTAEDIRPFDRNRSGTLFGEGAGVLVLERRAHAEARGARIYAEVLGYGVNNNAYHLTAPDKGGEGMVHALRLAFAEARIAPEEIDYVNAHGTGTPYHDVAETLAIKAVLGDHAYRIPVSSIKAATAHPMAAAGSLEAIASVLAMRDGVVPPTLNYETPDPDCDLDYVPHAAREAPVRCVLSISSGIGGNNAAVIVRCPLSLPAGE